MLLILWIFLCTGQILQWFLSLLLNWQKIFSSKLETGLERQRNVQLLFLGFSVQKRRSEKDHQQGGFISPVFHDTHRNKGV